MAPRVDLAALKRSLADARLIARFVGVEKGAQAQAGGLVTRCPVHDNRSASLSMQVKGGVLLMNCLACPFKGDVLSLFEALEGSFEAGLARAVEVAGGAAPAPLDAPPERPAAPALPDDLAAALLGRVCEVGRLGTRGPVEAYLDRRGLLNAAREDGWASLSPLPRLLDIAREVWQAMGAASARGDSSDGPVAPDRERLNRARAQNEGPQGSRAKAPARASGVCASGVIREGAFAFSGPEDLLVAARLARRDGEGRLRAKWGRHRLVIPWRGRNGRIQVLQRRLIDDSRPMRSGGVEPRYVFDGAPREPFGVHWLGEEERHDENRERRVWAAGQTMAGDHLPADGVEQFQAAYAAPRALGSAQAARAAGARRQVVSGAPIALVEGAVDALALRCLRPRSVPLGVPGVARWLSSWERHLEGRDVFFAFDAAEEGDRQAAFRALDVARLRGELDEGAVRARRERLGRRHADEDDIARKLEHGKISTDEAEKRRAALAPAWCALCGAPARWLCGPCGRVRPRAKDWGTVWEGKIRRRV